MNFDSKINTIKAREIENKWMTSNQTTKLHCKSLYAKTKEGCIPLSHVNQACKRVVLGQPFYLSLRAKGLA
jgi:hypothetical protein